MSGRSEAQSYRAWLSDRFLPARWKAASPAPLPSSRGMLEGAVRGLELVIRRALHIYEFTADRECIFRLGLTVAEDEVTLGDGTEIVPGDPILELHLWNEQLPAIPREGPRIAWGLVMRDRALHSLRLLAAHLRDDGAYPGVKALRGEAAFTSRIGRRQMVRVARRYGFEMFQGNTPLHRRFRFFWENFLIWGLVWAFNPGGLRGKSLIKERFELWISREVLVSRYAGPPARPPSRRCTGAMSSSGILG
ncbi:MAG TPA: hypothetical protein VFA50_00695 [Stellaceae bacterium]|nr:hypothetical protein [Stellaceae bacterium]